ncbi:MAG TPA: YbjN domain-containing protein [Bordetella sp.]|nr:YbjN domain-containing protein [Bordetella sp.]
MTDTLPFIQALSADSLTDLLQRAGYRVTRSEQNGLVQLLSASQGVGFSVRFGNPGTQPGEYVDYTLSCALRVQGDLPAGLAEGWNLSKRFARMATQGAFLVLEMDVVVAGGVNEAHLLAMAELWDRVLQEFLLYLRQYAQQAEAAASTTAGTAGAAEAQTEEPQA